MLKKTITVYVPGIFKQFAHLANKFTIIGTQTDLLQLLFW